MGGAHALMEVVDGIALISLSVRFTPPFHSTHGERAAPPVIGDNRPPSWGPRVSHLGLFLRSARLVQKKSFWLPENLVFD